MAKLKTLKLDLNKMNDEEIEAYLYLKRAMERMKIGDSDKEEELDDIPEFKDVVKEGED